MKKKQKSYSADFKQEAVRRMAQAKTITGLAKELGLRRKFLYQWRHQLEAEGRAGLERRSLGYHLKTGHTLSVQNRPTGLAEDVIVLPCCSVRLQGLGLSPRGGVCYCGFTLPGSRLAE